MFDNAMENLVTIYEGAQSLKRTFDAISTSYDNIVKTTRSQNGTKKRVVKKEEHLGPAQVSQGWYVDSMAGLQRKFPKSWSSLKTVTNVQRQRNQLQGFAPTNMARINDALLLDMNGLASLAAVQGPTTIGRGANQKAYILTNMWKSTFTNLSNIKICYEYYYVTPKKDNANTFQADVATFMGLIDNPSGYEDVFTNWKPEDSPEILKRWRILSKSVFRLGPGETGELHCKDRVYRAIGAGDFQGERTFTRGLNTQLYVRWYGAPTGVFDPTLVSGVPVGVTGATFGDNGCQTVWVSEVGRNYFLNDIDYPELLLYSTNVPATVTAPNIVVTREDDDVDIVDAN